MPQPPKVGRGQFSIKGSYSIIPSDPVKVRNERQLLMDDYVVDDWWDCRRTVHQPEKHLENPLIVPRKPWEGPGPGNGTVLYDREIGRFRLWGDVWDRERELKGDPLSYRGIYYESEDGVHWEAPELGLIEFEGSKANNLILGGEWQYSSLSVFALPPRLSSRGRFAMLYGRSKPGLWWEQGVEHTMEQRIALSDDGIRWKDQTENPAFRGRSDTYNNVVYNPERDVFMQYRRPSVNGHEIRRVSYSESKDLISWTQPLVIIKPDELDPPMLYGMSVCRYQGIYLGLLQMFYFDAQVRLPKSHQIDVELSWSRDGIRWERHPQRPVFLECGLIPSYDWGMIVAWNDIVECDDRLYIYYTGDPWLHDTRVGWPMPTHLCLATLPKDRFVSVDPLPGRDGYMLTKPLECPGGRLHLNARAGADGFVRVAVRRGDGEADGEWLPEWNYDKNVSVSGDSLDQVVNWEGQHNLDSLKGKSVRLHFWLNNAELYSFWFE